MNEEFVPENGTDTRITQEQPCLPGAELRAAREAKGLPPEAVAQVTRFSVRQIEALERDDYASLPGITVVRGLVRSYAKFLKLDAMPLLAALDSAVPVADVRAPAHMGEATQPGFLQRAGFRLAAFVMAGLLLLLGTFWYIIRPDGEVVPNHAQLQVSQSVPAVAAEPAVASPVPAPDGASPAVSAVVVPAPVEAASGVPGAPTPAPTPVAATPAVPPGLRLEFDAFSWVEIRDATQQVVFSGEYPAGTRQNVAGKAPFQLWIGKASGVKVFSGERSIDLKPYTREDVARLTVE